MEFALLRPVNRKYSLLLVLVAFGVLWSAGPLASWSRGRIDAGMPRTQPPATDVAAQIAGLVKVTLYSQQERSDAQQVWKQVEAFYAARGFQPAWQSAEGRDAARILIDRMAMADRDGLRADDYQASTWSERLAEAEANGSLPEAVRFDVQLSAAILQFATHLALGVGEGASARDVDIAELLADVRDARSARDAIVRLEPSHAPYRELRRALADYRKLEARGGWPPVPEGVLLQVEDEVKVEKDADDQGRADEQAAVAVCRRLAVSGDLDVEKAHGNECGFEDAQHPGYDTRLEQAVRRFQARHGLASDGIVGPNTIAALNVPVEDRIAQLIVNMNRWRRLPGDLGPVHVHVNIPGFRLDANQHGESVLSMRVVAGEAETPTPVMSDAISYLEFSPYWNVPTSITRNELLPAIARDPAYLRQQRLEVVDGWDEPADIVDPSTIDWQAALDRFPYRLRQKPGSHNSLGLVKFMFPNEYSVYLHDTPATHRFAARRRAFSHGCVRVEDPVALAEFLLRDDPQWSRTSIRAAMDRGERSVVPLPEPVPVHLTYFTAWVTGSDVHFRHDIYGLDAADRRAFDRVPSTETTPPSPDEAL